MTSPSELIRDERTAVVENTSYRLAYMFITYALLLDVMYRSLLRNEAAWDLLALVILGGAISFLYQGWRGVISAYSLKFYALLAVVAFVVAAVVAALLSHPR